MMDRGEPAPAPPDPDASGVGLPYDGLTIESITASLDELENRVRSHRGRLHRPYHRSTVDLSASPTEAAPPQPATPDHPDTVDPDNDLSVEALMQELDRLEARQADQANRSHRGRRHRPYHHQASPDAQVDTTTSTPDTDTAPAPDEPTVPAPQPATPTPDHDTTAAAAPTPETDADELTVDDLSASLDKLIEMHHGSKPQARPGQRRHRTPQVSSPGVAPRAVLDETKEYPKLIVSDPEDPSRTINNDETTEHEPIPQNVLDAVEVLESDTSDKDELGSALGVVYDFNRELGDTATYKILERRPDWRTAGDPSKELFIFGVSVEKLLKLPAKARALVGRIGNFSLRGTIENIKSSLSGGNVPDAMGRDPGRTYFPDEPTGEQLAANTGELDVAAGAAAEDNTGPVPVVSDATGENAVATGENPVVGESPQHQPWERLIDNSMHGNAPAAINSARLVLAEDHSIDTLRTVTGLLLQTGSQKAVNFLSDEFSAFVIGNEEDARGLRELTQQIEKAREFPEGVSVDRLGMTEYGTQAWDQLNRALVSGSVDEILETAQHAIETSHHSAPSLKIVASALLHSRLEGPDAEKLVGFVESLAQGEIGELTTGESVDHVRENLIQRTQVRRQELAANPESPWHEFTQNVASGNIDDSLLSAQNVIDRVGRDKFTLEAVAEGLLRNFDGDDAERAIAFVESLAQGEVRQTSLYEDDTKILHYRLQRRVEDRKKELAEEAEPKLEAA